MESGETKEGIEKLKGKKVRLGNDGRLASGKPRLIRLRVEKNYKKIASAASRSVWIWNRELKPVISRIFATSGSRGKQFHMILNPATAVPINGMGGFPT